MTRVLWSGHPCFDILMLKWFAVALSTAMVLVGIVTYTVEASDGLPSWTMLTLAWLMPAGFVALGPANLRATEWTLQLPVSTRRVWSVHVGVVATLAGSLLVCGLGPLTLMAVLVNSGSHPDAASAAMVARLPAVWFHSIAWLLLVLALTVHHRLDLARVPRNAAWLGRQVIVLTVAAVGLFGLGDRAGLLPGIVVLAAAGAWLATGWRAVPAALSMMPHEPSAPSTTRTAVPLTASLPLWRRRPLWLVVMMSCAKHPALNLVAYPFVVLFGMWNSPWGQSLSDSGGMSLTFIAMSAYLVFVMTASPFFRLSRLDWMPISRDRMLLMIMLPTLAMLVLGYGLGDWIVSHDRTAGDQILYFRGDLEHYGVRIKAPYLALAWDAPPDIVTPGGQTVTPTVCWRLDPLSRAVVYKPYETPPGTSLDDCAWQLERASAAIFQRPVPAAVFKERYLMVDDDGLVVPRMDAQLRLQSDLADLRLRRFQGLPPLQTLLVGLLAQACLIIMLAACGPGVPQGRRKKVYGILLGVLMAMHLGQFVLAIAGVIDLDALSAAAHWSGEWLAAEAPMGRWGLWLAVGLLLAPGHLLVHLAFRRAEFVPARDGDLFTDMMG